MLPVNGTPWGSKNRLEIGMISKQIRDFLNCKVPTNVRSGRSEKLCLQSVIQTKCEICGTEATFRLLR